MRIRQVRQEFWTDEKLATQTDAVRLFYIGLWCVCDDLGWFRADPGHIGALLYPYSSPKVRVRHVQERLDILVELGRVKLMECGCGTIPTLPRHQVIGGKKSETERIRHAKEHLGGKVPDLPYLPGTSDIGAVPDVPGNPGGRVGNGRVGNGRVEARARDQDQDDGEPRTEFQARVPRPTAAVGR